MPNLTSVGFSSVIAVIYHSSLESLLWGRNRLLGQKNGDLTPRP